MKFCVISVKYRSVLPQGMALQWQSITDLHDAVCSGIPRPRHQGTESPTYFENGYIVWFQNVVLLLSCLSFIYMCSETLCKWKQLPHSTTNTCRCLMCNPNFCVNIHDFFLQCWKVIWLPLQCISTCRVPVVEAAWWVNLVWYHSWMKPPLRGKGCRGGG